VLIERPDAAERLRAAGIVVRPASDFAGLDGDHVRITARTAAENARLVEVLST
jgi:histidinol-phosphate/aromatic aminotransferase/cobyric acid decarboxylase-like protein